MRTFALVIIFVCANINAQEILYRQSFEDTNVNNAPELVWQVNGYPTSQKVVSHQPKHGQKSIRGNFNSKVLDPITNMYGTSFPHFYLDFTAIPTVKDWIVNADEVYLSWWFKYDKCLYKGSNNANSDPKKLVGKFAYIRMNQNPAESYYLTPIGGNTGEGKLQSNKGDWMDLWQSLYGKVTLYTNTGASYGADGRWHKISAHIKNIGSSSASIAWWIDRDEMKAAFNDSEYFQISSDFRPDSIQFFYSSENSLDQSQNIGEDNQYCNGWQLDDIQIWDKLPNHPILVN